MRRAAVALSLAVLFFGRQIAAWSVAENRYLYHWQRADSIYLIGAVVAAALLALVLAPDAEKPFEGAALAAFVVAGLTLHWFRRAEDRVVRVAVTAALLTVPLGPILSLQILSWKSWRERAAPAPAPGPPAADAGHPIFILLFDGAGRLDSALAIVTSDHGWKKDPEKRERAGRERRGSGAAGAARCGVEFHTR